MPIIGFGWLSSLDTHRDNLLYSLESEDGSYVAMRNAIAAQNAVDPSLALFTKGAPQEVDAKLRKLNETAAQAQNDVFDNFKKETDGIKDVKIDGKDKESIWQSKLESKRDQLKKQSSDAIEKSFSDAKAYISTLPNDQRESATGVFSAGADIVGKFANDVFAKIKDLLGNVANWLRGAWDTVSRAASTVKNLYTRALGLLSGKQSPLSAMLPPSSSSGLFECAISFVDKTSLGQAATVVDAYCLSLDTVIQQVSGDKPVFTLVRSSVNCAASKSTASLLFKVDGHADVLGEHFKGLLSKSQQVLSVDWSAHGSSSESTAQDQVQQPVANADCSFALKWAKKSMDKAAVEATLNYLQGAVASALDSRYVVQTLPIEGTLTSWESAIVCKAVPTKEGPHISSVMKDIFSKELDRQTPLTDAPNVPTPNKFTSEEV